MPEDQKKSYFITNQQLFIASEIIHTINKFQFHYDWFVNLKF